MGEILVSVEMIDESVNPVPAEHRRAKIEMARIVERHHYVLTIPEDDRGELRIEVLFERGTEPLNERPRPRLLRNAERSRCLSKLSLWEKVFRMLLDSSSNHSIAPKNFQSWSLKGDRFLLELSPN